MLPLMNMIKKFILILLISVVLLGISTLSFCLAAESNTASNCCSNDALFFSLERKYCLSRCFPQKAVSIKTENFFTKDIKKGIRLLLQSNVPDHFLFRLNYAASYYFGQIITHIEISRIYFEALFNRAPPFIS